MKTIKIFIAKSIDLDWKAFAGILRETQWQTANALNYCVSEWYIWQREKERMKLETGRYPSGKKVPDPSKRLYKEIRGLYPELSSQMASTIVNKTRLRWQSEVKQIVSLSMSLPTYSKTHPVILHNQAYSINRDGQGYIVTATFRSSEVPKERRRLGFLLNTKKLRGGQRRILQHIVDGEYKRGEGKIGFNERKKKWYISVAYTPPKKEINLDPDVIVGVNFGQHNAYYCAVSNSGKRHRATAGEIRQYRQRIRLRKTSIQQQGNISSRKGRGRNKYLGPATKLFEAERRFRDSRYHQYSKAIVAFAEDNQAGTIRLGYPSEGHKNSRDGVITDWALSDLHLKITYKAQETGIQVVKVSQGNNQRCAVCNGYIKVEDSGKFGCLECGVRGEVDYNAAKNLTLVVDP